MDNDVLNLGNNLQKYFENKEYSSAANLIRYLLKQFSDGQLPSSLIDHHLLNIFNKNNGIVWFIEKIVCISEYKPALVNALNLLSVITNNIGHRIKNYAVDLIGICRRVVNSSARSFEKASALKIIGRIVEQQLVNNEEVKTLYDELWNRFCGNTSCSTVLLQVCTNLGIIIKHFPYLDDINHVAAIFINKMRNEMFDCGKYKTKTLVASEGCLNGLFHSLENRYSDLSNENKCNLISCIEEIIQSKNEKIKALSRAALNFLQKHMSLFSQEIYNRYNEWYKIFFRSMKKDGVENKKVAFYVMLVFYKEMGIVAYKSENGKDITKVLVNYRINNLSKEDDPYFTHLSIKSIGFFAKAIHKHSPEKLDGVLTFLSQKMEEKFFLQREDVLSDNMDFLPDYIFSLGAVISLLKNVTDLQLSIIYKSSILLIQLFPKVLHNKQFLVIDSLLAILCNLKENNEEIVSNYLQVVLYQAVLWTCSHEIKADAEILKDNQNVITYEKFMPLWNGLINLRQKYIQDAEKTDALRREIFEELVRILLVLINKLDLSTKLKTEENNEEITITTDLEKVFEPTKVADIIIFVNVVDFYQNIFMLIEKLDATLFRKWIPTFSDNIIKKSQQNPLCSGFYKLLTSCLKLAKKLDYFSNERIEKFNYVQVTYESIYSYLQIILQKVNYFKEDLLISCLELLMSIPESMVKSVLPQAVPAFVTLLTIGRSYLKLAHLAIDTLEEWFLLVPTEEITPFLEQVIPELYTYLESPSLNEKGMVDYSQFKTRKTEKAVMKRKVYIESETELLQLQHKILLFLGKLDSNICYKFVNSKSKVEPVIWGEVSRLKINLPFEDGQIEVPLEKFVPQVLNIALYSSSRKNRVTACELLHATTLILLGVGKTANDDELNDLGEVLKKLFVPLLQLACDVDVLVKQIFEPFIMQLIHWYSHPSQKDGLQAEIVREGLLEAITDSSNSSLRDFAGKCVKEYINWTKRQTKTKRSIDIEEFWIEKIKTLSKHPDIFKRAGAILLFNNIYTELRENSDVVNIYWLEILAALITSLSFLNEDTPKEDVLLLETFSALDHVKRVLVEKNDRFNRPHSDRNVPVEFEGCTLKDAAVWLLGRIGSLSSHCRQKCEELFVKIAPKIDNVETIEEFGKKYLENVKDWLKRTFKLSELQSNNLIDCKSIESVFKWLSLFLCAVEGHIFIVENKIFAPRVVFENEGFLEATQNVLIFFQHTPIENNDLMHLTAVDKQKLKNLKGEIVNTLIDFLRVVLKKKYVFEFRILWTKHMLNFVIICVFEPYLLGVDLIKIEDFSVKVVDLLNLLNENTSEEEREIFSTQLQDYIKNNREDFIDLKAISVPYKQRQMLKGILLLQKTSFSQKLKIQEIFNDFISKLFGKLVSNSVFMKLNKPVTEFYDLQLQIVLVDNKSNMLEIFRNILCDELVTLEGTDKEFKKGRLFYETFKDTIGKVIVNNFTEFRELIYNHTPEDLYYFNMQIMSYIKKFKSSFQNNVLKTLIIKMAESWDKMSEIFNNDKNNILKGLDYLSKFMEISEIPRFIGKGNNLFEWIVQILNFRDKDWNNNQNLQFKARIIDLLPCITGYEDQFQPDLLEALRSIYEKDIKDTCSFIKMTIPIIIKKSFDCLKTSKSLTILSYCLNIYVCECEYVNEIPLQAIVKQYMRTQNIEYQLNALNLAWEECKCTNKFSNHNRYILVRDILTLMLRYSLYPAFENFFKKNIIEIYNNLKNDCDHLTSDQIVDRTLYFILIEVLFCRIDIDKMTDNTCPINASVFGNECPGKQLLKELTKIAVDVGKKDFNGADAEIIRLFNCHTYNALISMIANTQDELYCFLLLFPKDKEEGDIRWNKLFDINKKYTFNIDFEKIPQRKNKIISIRATIEEQSGHKVNSKYLQSQRLFDSTLSEDISRYDFNNSIIRSQVEENLENKDTETRNSFLYLDSIDLNEHECMATFCGLIRHLVDNEISPLPEGENIILPDWMKAIQRTLINDKVPVNVKLFLVKVIENVEDVFKPYAKWFLEPIMNLIVKGCVGNEINYFVADLIMVLLSWSVIAIPENKEITTELLKFLMKGINNKRKALMKEDLNLIKLFVEKWKSCFNVPHYELKMIFCKGISEKIDQIIAIHLTAIFIVNGLTPWKSDEAPHIINIFRARLKLDAQEIYYPVAETLGMMLNYIQDIPKLIEDVERDVQSFRPEKRLPILVKISMHYPSMVDKSIGYFVNLINVEPSSTFKAHTLTLMLANPKVTAETYGFKLINFEALLNCPDLEVQILTLTLLSKLFTKIDSENMVKILKKSSQFSSNSSDKCRETMFDFVINVYNHSTDVDILKICTEILLKGLIDPNLEIQNKIYEFWNNFEKSNTLNGRLEFILDKLYSPGDLEEFYMGYSSALVFGLTQNRSEFGQKLFQYELQKCTHENYKLVNFWRAQHTSFAPLFASSIRSQQSAWSQNILSSDLVMATQNELSFLPTQQFHQQNDEKLTDSTSTSFSISLNPDNSSTSWKSGKNKADSNLIKSNIRKRRICNDQQLISRNSANFQVLKQEKIMEKRRDVVKEREKNVNIYRSYKKGDFPDIGITLSEVLDPLKALSKNDSYIARQLFNTILNGYINMNKHKENNIVVNLSSKINEILNKSINFVPNLVGAFLEIAITNKKLVILKPETVFTASISSGLYCIGSLLLEEYLIHLDFSEEISKKKIGDETEESKCWLILGGLYKEMNNWDVVKEIFINKLTCNENVVNAFTAESSGQWSHALNCYKSAIESDLSVLRQEFYYESCFNCLANMGKWDDLSEQITEFVGEEDLDAWQVLWSTEKYQQKLLPWYIRSEVNKVLENTETDIAKNLNKSLKDSYQSNVLKTEFGEELAMLFLHAGDTDTSKQYINSKFNSFLGNWMNINPLFVQLKTNNLLSLKNAVDIFNFVKKLEKISVMNCQEIIDDLIYVWQKSKENGTSPILNEIKLLYREKFVDLMLSKVRNILMDEDEQNQAVCKLENFRYDLNMNFIELFTKLDNNELAYKYISKYVSKREENDIRWYLQFVTLAFRKIKEIDELENQVEKYINIWEEFGEAIKVNKNTNHLVEIIEASKLVFDISSELSTCLDTNQELFSKNICPLTELLSGYVPKKAKDVSNFGWMQLINILEDSYEKLNKNKNVVQCVGNAFIKLAYFYQDTGNEVGFIQSVLRGMKLGSLEGRQLFPCILTLSNLGKDHAELFINESSDVPLWMFLAWIPQILANLDNHIFPLKQIVLNIAVTYPEAIKYSYRLSRNKYSFKSGIVETEGRELLRQLDELLLNDESSNSMLVAFKFVTIPETLLQMQLKNLIKTSNENEFKDNLKSIIAETFPDDVNFNCAESFQGRSYRNISKYKNILSGFLTKKLDLMVIKNELINMMKELKPNPKSKFKPSLNDLCPWLHNFKPYHDKEVEIPGQYKGDQLPLPQYHAKIVGFSPEVSVMKSIRRPIKISILGHDAKDYSFLVKSGEDLRQDQRIEQLFCLMNHVLSSAPDCKGNQLLIQNYQVIPLIESLGLIEWVRNTVSLGEFIKNTFDKENKVCSRLSNDYNSWVTSVSRKNSDSLPQSYGKILKKFERDKTVQKYKSLVSEIPWDCLRQAFWNISIDSESFFALRHSFCVSYAVMCISHWIIGIGDRHLNNTLVSLDTALPIGIDFGFAFGVSTQILPIPEVIPFRLTPHILNLLKPLNHHGLLQETMARCLRAYRRNRHVLLATLNVFIKEPSLEWAEHAKHWNGSENTVSWYPEQKIKHCRQKLEGVNPVKIMTEELETGNSEFKEDYVKLIEGDPQHCVRATFDGLLTEEQQVRCLIDHATDENILGRLYAGLEAWI